MLLKDTKIVVYAVFRPLALVISIFLANLVFTRNYGFGGRLEGMKGLPIPYFYIETYSNPDTYNQLSYFIDLFFWMVFFTILIDLVLKWRAETTKTYILTNYLLVNAALAETVNLLTLIISGNY